MFGKLFDKIHKVLENAIKAKEGGANVQEEDVKGELKALFKEELGYSEDTAKEQTVKVKDEDYAFLSGVGFSEATGNPAIERFRRYEGKLKSKSEWLELGFDIDEEYKIEEVENNPMYFGFDKVSKELASLLLNDPEDNCHKLNDWELEQNDFKNKILTHHAHIELVKRNVESIENLLKYSQVRLNPQKAVENHRWLIQRIEDVLPFEKFSNFGEYYSLPVIPSILLKDYGQIDDFFVKVLSNSKDRLSAKVENLKTEKAKKNSMTSFLTGLNQFRELMDKEKSSFNNLDSIAIEIKKKIDSFE